MKIKRVDDHWDWYFDEDSQLRFELSTRDLPHNLTRVMIHKGRELICECTFISETHLRPDMTRYGAVTINEAEFDASFSRNKSPTARDPAIAALSNLSLRGFLAEAISAIFVLNRFVSSQVELTVDFRPIVASANSDKYSRHR